MAKSPSGECHDCGDEYQRLRQHWAMSDCGPDDSAKKEYECAECGDAFKDYPTRRQTRGREKFFCSKTCKNLHQKNGEYRTCANCGGEVYKPKSHLSQAGNYALDHHFCDKDCEQEWKRSNWVLENHPNWRGGKGGIDAVRKKLAENSWRDTARRAREQSDGQCALCGSRAESRELDVHHIIPVAAGGTNGDYNLMVLCIGCHRKVESYTRQFTTPHLYEFAE